MIAGEIYSRPVNERLFEVWTKVLTQSRVPIKHFQSAFDKHFQTGRFFPTPADILAHCPEPCALPNVEEIFAEQERKRLERGRREPELLDGR